MEVFWSLLGMGLFFFLILAGVALIAFCLLAD